MFTTQLSSFSKRDLDENILVFGHDLQSSNSVLIDPGFLEI